MARASESTRQRLRWDAVDGERQQSALFGSEAERVTHPEFRDLEFVHVRAKSIINTLPDGANLPFRHTINVYRGCSHACVYCLHGDTPILMADGRTKPLADVEIGDAVYGTVRRGAYRRYVTTRVLDHWSTLKPAYRVVLEDGTELVASGDHRFLTDRGWKHVTGAEQGLLRRPHLTTNNKLLGTGRFYPPPTCGEDYRRGYLCGMIRSDGHVGTYSYNRPGRRHGDVHRFRLALGDDQPLQRTRTYLLDRGIKTTEFVFQRTSGNNKPLNAIRAYSRAAVGSVRETVDWPSSPSNEWCKGYLAGIFDAEGSYSRGILRIVNSDDQLIDHIAKSLRRFHFTFRLEPPRPNGCRSVRLTGGLREHLRFFHMTDPATMRKRTVDGVALKSDASLQVASVEPLGTEFPLYDITTGTGDFIANGVVSHNCFARPTHEYLNLDSGRDFERVIVVKVNAVEVLRSELRRGWAGEHIAMGTNTDPYQRAEGRYRLTRGVIETLTEAANPFSILTKSALVLRDVDLLREANERSDTAVNFSVGTLDPDVWKRSEPGTPHPMKRIEAIAELREAGIPSGVLIAPILPGISDAPEQLEAVVEAALDAGATSISPILLHLRPGVKEVFMPWLEDQHPNLVGRYERLYPSSYAPSVERRGLAKRVRDLVDDHGGLDTDTSAANARNVRDSKATGRDRPPDVEQPSLPL